MESTQVRHHGAWNKGKLVGQKAPFKLKEIWAGVMSSGRSRRPKWTVVTGHQMIFSPTARSQSPSRAEIELPAIS